MNEDYCLWMGDIDPKMDESIIRKFFLFYNVNPQDIKLIKDKKSNKSKNHCFIYFQNIFEANNILNQLNGKPIPNTTLRFKLKWAHYLTPETKIIFVGNLNPLVDDTSLLNFFKSKYNSVLKAKIIKDNGKSKKYGFVTFKKGKDYRKSLIEMNGIFFNGTNIRVKEYIKKDEDENNNKQNLFDNINNQLELNNDINNNINNNVKLFNKNNLNSESFLSFSNLINKINWINANPICNVNIGIKHNNININSKSSLFNTNKISHNYNNNYDEKNKIININNCINDNRNYNFFINSNKNNINCISKGNKNNNIINYNSKINNIPKLEILEEFDEITLKMKINESLSKMLEYYKESRNRSSVVSKLILYLIFV